MTSEDQHVRDRDALPGEITAEGAAAPVAAPAMGKEAKRADIMGGPVTVPITPVVIVPGIPSPPRRVEEERSRRLMRNHAKIKADTREGPVTVPVRPRVIALGIPSPLRRVEEATCERRNRSQPGWCLQHRRARFAKTRTRHSRCPKMRQLVRVLHTF